jgi:hypothetical protein
LPAVKRFRLELGVRIALGDGLSESSRVSNRLADGEVTVRLQHASEGSGNDGHRFHGNAVLVDQLHIRPRTSTVFGRCSTFPPETDGVVASRVHQQDRFQAEFAFPVIDTKENLPIELAKRPAIMVSTLASYLSSGACLWYACWL